MTMHEREGLIARIRHLRRQAAAQPAERTGPAPDRLEALEARVAHLERQLEGLQDSVHRESDRHEEMIAELRAQIQPAAMGAALAKDARNRGL